MNWKAFSPIIAISLCVALAVSRSFAAEASKDLIVYGSRFSFKVREPDKWVSDTGAAARKFSANIIFFRIPVTGKVVSDPVIRIRVNSKSDENVSSDMKYDMDGYRKRYSDISFQKLDILLPYPGEAKIFQREGKFYEYVVYLDPGKGVPNIFSISMNLQEHPASPEDLEVFSKVVNSIWWLTGTVIDQTKK